MDTVGPVAIPVAPELVEIKLLAAEPVIEPVPDWVLIKELPLPTERTPVADVDTADPVAVEPEIVPLEPTLVEVPCAVADSLAVDEVAEAATAPDAIEDEPEATDDEPVIIEEPALTVVDGRVLAVEA